MKSTLNLNYLSLCFLLLFAASSSAADTCLSETNLRKLDASYELAVLTSDVEFAEAKMHPSFVWVHNHASSTQDSRNEIIQMFNRTSSHYKEGEDRGDRTQEDVEIVIAGNTGVVHGFTKVRRSKKFIDLFNSPEFQRYHFMRTYTFLDNSCFLLSNHTMLVSEGS
ncbi:MAG: DUF4440 domain-containing protein [Pseudomonadales bacterium]|nr:DUF4440 domain-containing protein [Pseudomonadales bacterium]